MLIVVNYIPRFDLYNYKQQCFQRFLKQKNVLRVLVLNLFEISKEFFVFIDLKITELTRLTTIQSRLLLLNKYFVHSLLATRARQRFRLCAHFYPIMNIS